MRVFLFFTFFLLQFTHSIAQDNPLNPLLSIDSIVQQKWVDSILVNMTLDEKIGQLFMVQAYSNKGEKEEQEISNYIEKYKIGGLIFMQGSPKKQVELYTKYQKKSKIPLLVGFDGEWGLSMRLKPSFAYPWNMTLGAVQNDSIIYQVGKQIGKHAKEVGVHINFAPVVDININPKNPIIGNRSFGEDRENVTNKAIAFTQGMQSVGVLANAKHFPGHGDTASDSHKTLPILNLGLDRLDSIELYPYKKLAQSNLGSVMVAHLDVPAFKTKKGRPTSISKKVITNLLKQKIGFKGLVFTDALNMKGIAKFTAADSVALEALNAGNDMLLIPTDVEKSMATIKKNIQEKQITEQRLDSSVIAILRAKYWVGLSKNKTLTTSNLQKRIHTVTDDLLYKKVVENAVTLVKNDADFLPLKRLDTLKIASLTLGDAANTTFIETLNKYTRVSEVKDVTLENLQTKFKKYNTVIIGVHKSSKHPWKSYKIAKKDIALLQAISKHKKVILTVFTSPYALLDLKGFTTVSNVVVAYQNDPVFQSVAAQQIFGALPFLGKLPVSVSDTYKVGSGSATKAIQRLQYGAPEEEKMSSLQLSKIDSVAAHIIKKKMTPGLQVLVAKNSKVIFEKSYGHFTYDSLQKVTNASMYDLASLTKILGALPLYLKAFEKGVYKLDSTLADLLPELKGSEIADLLVIDVFAHQSGLQAWIPFYEKTIDSISNLPSEKVYSKINTRGFDVKVARDLYLKRSYIDTIYKEIKNTPLRKKRNYKYSGLSFFLFKSVLERYYHLHMDEMFEEQFSEQLGANKLLYNPLRFYKSKAIVPSEIDTYYRHQTLQGDVHDMAAAMLGGVSGNAGLFGNANNVAKMMQLYLNGGVYGAKKYFRANTFKLFNKAYFKQRKNRRGLVLDKPDIKGEVENTCNCVSMDSFGHSGFTGTFAWADPKTNLIYVFLSNRTYPTMKNNALGKNNIRTEIQKIIQKAIL